MGLDRAEKDTEPAWAALRGRAKIRVEPRRKPGAAQAGYRRLSAKG